MTIKPDDLCNVSLNSLPASDVCRLLIIFANRLDPDQAQQYVGPDLDPNRLTLLKDNFEKANFDFHLDEARVHKI